jgi:hypothetical protein
MPIGKVSPIGVTEMKLMAGAVTVTVADCLTEPMLAEIVVEPAATPVSNPVVVTVATADAEELQLTSKVMSRLLPSL